MIPQTQVLCAALARGPSRLRQWRSPSSLRTRGFPVASRKPDPVVGDHPSGTSVTERLVRPKPGSLGRATLKRSPIWSCTRRGLPSRPVTRTAGELLPHRFTLTRTSVEAAGGLLSVALSLGFPRLDVIQRPALWCPDFPRWGASHAPKRRATRPRRGHLACPCSVPSAARARSLQALPRERCTSRERPLVDDRRPMKEARP